MTIKKLRILWWGRGDPGYSRNAILRKILREKGHEIIDFKPFFSKFGTLQARFSNLASIDLVWVPCFRHRDVMSAFSWTRSHGLPLVFDPLISAYDKQVFERHKFTQDSTQANRLYRWERKRFHAADWVIADTQLHADWFAKTFELNPSRLLVLPVSADEDIFHPSQHIEAERRKKFRVLFYGSFLQLHGIDVIAEAVRRTGQVSIEWRLIGNGPMLDKIRSLLGTQENLNWSEWVDYEKLPQEISVADLVLGIFGAGEKASRVIPNKVYQAMACARPVLTMSSSAYPSEIHDDGFRSGLFRIPSNDPDALTEMVLRLSETGVGDTGIEARRTYEQHFSNNRISQGLELLFNQLYPNP